MIIFDKEYKSFSEIRYLFSALNKSINTTYLPVSDNLNDFLAEVIKTNFAREFSSSKNFPEAFISLEINNRTVRFVYSSISCTQVELDIFLDNKMAFKNALVAVSLPDDRIAPGRYGYESLTGALIPFGGHEWINYPDGEIIPHETFPTPQWVIKKSNSIKLIIEEASEKLLPLGYHLQPGTTPGFCAHWKWEGEEERRLHTGIVARKEGRSLLFATVSRRNSFIHQDRFIYLEDLLETKLS